MRMSEAEYAAFSSRVQQRNAPTPPTPSPLPSQTGLQRMQALGRLKTGEMNKTEAAYEQQLAYRKHAGEVKGYWFEGMKFRLADSTFYTPDFAVQFADGSIEFHEVKGFMTDDAAVKIKVAASMYPFRFLLVYARRKKDGGGFTIKEV